MMGNTNKPSNASGKFRNAIENFGIAGVGFSTGFVTGYGRPRIGRCLPRATYILNWRTEHVGWGRGDRGDAPLGPTKRADRVA